MRRYFSKYWFICGLVLLSAITMTDKYEWTVGAGRWLKDHGGPNLVIISIFVLSGCTLDVRLLRKGLKDINATVIALAVILVFSPILAMGFQILPINIQILAGLYLVAAMPTTLSSGVVMTQRAGGNMAHALFVTIVSNTLAVLTIPVVLSFLLTTLGDNRTIEIDKAAIMLKITFLVLLPLIVGMIIRCASQKWILKVEPKVQIMNQLLVLLIVWIGMCQSRETIVAGGTALIPIGLLAFSYHLLLVLSALGATRLFGIGPGRRESVIFMGGQKTLPLSVILQGSLFPDYGMTLVVCVVHHIIHLIMDAYLAEKTKKVNI